MWICFRSSEPAKGIYPTFQEKNRLRKTNAWRDLSRKRTKERSVSCFLKRVSNKLLDIVIDSVTVAKACRNIVIFDIFSIFQVQETRRMKTMTPRLHRSHWLVYDFAKTSGAAYDKVPQLSSILVFLAQTLLKPKSMSFKKSEFLFSYRKFSSFLGSRDIFKATYMELIKCLVNCISWGDKGKYANWSRPSLTQHQHLWLYLRWSIGWVLYLHWCFVPMLLSKDQIAMHDPTSVQVVHS